MYVFQVIYSVSTSLTIYRLIGKIRRKYFC
jgi:hypothetical protein